MTLQYMESSAQSQRPHRPLSHSKMTIITTQTKVKLSYPMMAMPLINHTVVHCCYLIEKHRLRYLHHLAELILLQSSGASILATELMTILMPMLHRVEQPLLHRRSPSFHRNPPASTAAAPYNNRNFRARRCSTSKRAPRPTSTPSRRRYRQANIETFKRCCATLSSVTRLCRS